MTEHTNPRKLTTSGGMHVVSVPPGFWEQCNMSEGDQVVLEPGDEQFVARKVTYEVSTDE